MLQVEKIIRILDEALISSKKSYLSIQQCNKILLQNGIFTESDVSNKVLKRCLEEKLISNAYKTPHAPYHWRIVHSGKTYTSDLNVQEPDIVKERDKKVVSTSEAYYCSVCGKAIPVNVHNNRNLLLKCPNCSNIIPNPERYSSLKHYFNRVFDKYWLQVVIGIVIVTIISVLFLIIKFGDSYHSELTKSENEKQARIEKLKSFASDVFREHQELYTDWAIIARIQQFEVSDYRNKDVNMELFSQELKNGEMLIYSSKVIIPDPKANAIKDDKYGLPLSFYYKFYFNDQDSLTHKYLIVVYNSDSVVRYNFTESPFKLLINKLMAKKKNDEWQKQRVRLAAKQEEENRKIQEQKTTQPSTVNVSEKVYHFRSRNYDIEKPDEIGFTTINEQSYHLINLNTMTVKQTSLLNGEWVEITYSIKSSYYEEGAFSTTYVLVVNSRGLKEVWFCPETNSLGYDYMDGTRIACYDLSVVD